MDNKPKGRNTKPGKSGGGRLITGSYLDHNSKPMHKKTPRKTGGGTVIISDNPLNGLECYHYFESKEHTGKADCPCNECTYVRMESDDS